MRLEDVRHAENEIKKSIRVEKERERREEKKEKSHVQC